MPNVVTTSADTASKPTGAGTPADALGATKRMSRSDDDGNQSNELECPSCGRDDFASTRGMKIHHKSAHGESIAEKVELTCQVCGGAFTVKPHREEQAKCCSRSCQSEWQKQSGINSGENASAWNGGDVDTRCEHCERVYKTKPAKADTSRFCSRECVHKWLSETQAGESHHQYTERVQLTCENCGDSYQRVPSLSESRFCSQSCMGEWMSDNCLGEQNRAWKGGYEGLYSGGWVKTREAALDRDDHQCQSCGVGESTHKSQFGQGLHVHHITPYVEFSDPQCANELTNLVTLCRDCHYNKWEGVPVRPQLID